MNFDPELDPAQVQIGYFLPHPPDAVWGALTEPTLLTEWLMRPIGFATLVGTHFIFEIPTDPPGEIASEVLLARPGEQLTLTWVDLRAERPARWVLDWSLVPHGRGTRLLLTHGGFDIGHPRQKMARNAMERGWRSALRKLREMLDRHKE